MTKYKLSIERDVSVDEHGFLLTLPAGFTFDHDPLTTMHSYHYETMAELKRDAKIAVFACNCKDCK